MKKCVSCGNEFIGYKNQQYCPECQIKRSRKKRKFVNVGETYGYIHVDSMSDRNYRCYKCHCTKCGNDFECQGSKVFIYAETGCAVCRKKASEEKKIENVRKMIGQKFGNLEVVDCAGIFYQYRSKTPVVKCRCLKCGEFTEIPLKRLVQGGASECAKCARKT